ncbi:MAG: cation diffusion facilitator family transporter [Bacteroidales bacterium]|nr:cation diffusion facilitator family transporter [Bacteroidales bacterium]
MSHEHHEHHEHHGHHHHHHHVAADNGQMRKILWIAIILNLLFVGVEAGVGLWQNSLSLLSDAGHNLSDVFSLVLVVVGLHLVKVHSNEHYTYGYKKSTILISLANALLLLVAIGVIIAESVHKLREPAAIDGTVISWTAGIGILINGVTTLLLMRGQKGDLNIRGAFLHMAADTLVSIGVVISGIVIKHTGWFIIDPIISIAIAIVILVSTWELLRDSMRLALDGVPEGIEVDEVAELMRDTEHVTDVHHLHIWAMSTTENALTAHVVIDDEHEASAVRKALKEALRAQHITHATIEIENANDCCDSNVSC